jgi:hypothetical protein
MSGQIHCFASHWFFTWRVVRSLLKPGNNPLSKHVNALVYKTVGNAARLGMAARVHVLAFPVHAAAQHAVPTKEGLPVWVGEFGQLWHVALLFTSRVEQIREVEPSIELF